MASELIFSESFKKEKLCSKDPAFEFTSEGDAGKQAEKASRSRFDVARRHDKVVAIAREINPMA